MLSWGASSPGSQIHPSQCASLRLQNVQQISFDEANVQFPHSLLSFFPPSLTQDCSESAGLCISFFLHPNISTSLGENAQSSVRSWFLHTARSGTLEKHFRDHRICAQVPPRLSDGKHRPLPISFLLSLILKVSADIGGLCPLFWGWGCFFEVQNWSTGTPKIQTSLFFRLVLGDMNESCQQLHRVFVFSLASWWSNGDDSCSGPSLRLVEVEYDLGNINSLSHEPQNCLHDPHSEKVAWRLYQIPGNSWHLQWLHWDKNVIKPTAWFCPERPGKKYHSWKNYNRDINAK